MNWENNSRIIRERYPGLLEAIEQNSGDDPAENLKIENTAENMPTLVIGGRYVHSPRFPAREGRRLAEACLAETAVDAPPQGEGGGPVIVLGFGLGYAAAALAELAPQRPVIIVEKNVRLLRKALEARDLSRLLSRNGIVFIPGGSGEEVVSALVFFEKTINKNGLSNRCIPRILRNRTLTGIDEQWYAAVESRIRAWAMRDNVNAATLKKFGRRWVRNLSRNLSAIRDLPGISRLAGLAAATEAAPSGRALPVFLAAAGPGLDSIAALLPEIRKRCVMVAVDTSLRFMIKHGAAPDFALTVDPQFWNSRHLDRCVCPPTRLIAESAVYPPALRLPFEEVYLCGSLFPLGMFIEQRVDPKGELGAGGSVATGAWDFCRVLGAQEIWIAGLDLAFPGLRTHFRGAQFEEKAHAEAGRLNPAETRQIHALRGGSPFMAPALSGGQVLTDRRLSLYAAWFENSFSRFPAILNYSLSSGGLAMNGLVPAEAEMLLALPERRQEIDQKLAAAFSRIETDFYAPEETRRRGERYDGAAAALRSGLARIHNACERGIQITRQALRHWSGPAELKKILAALDETNSYITGSEVKEIAGFLFSPEALSEMNATGQSPDEGAAFHAYLKSVLRFYQTLKEACSEAVF